MQRPEGRHKGDNRRKIYAFRNNEIQRPEGRQKEISEGSEAKVGDNVRRKNAFLFTLFLW